MTSRLPFRMALTLLLVALFGLSALGASGEAPVFQTSVPTPTVFQRPLLTLISYSADSSVAPSGDFMLTFRVANEGGAKARNIVFAFVPGDLLPIGTGGVVAGGVIAPGADTGYSQGLIAAGDLAAPGVATLQIQASYTDDLGAAYSETFNLSFSVAKKPTSGGNLRPTVTPTLSPRPILLVDGYSVDVDPLKPGSVFDLSLRVTNAGGSQARGVTLVLGGGTGNTGPSGTPGADGGTGISGSGSNLENFAPLGESNVAYLGDLAQGALLTSIHALIVNSTTAPGAYPLPLSLIYSDSSGRQYTDDHVITMLVYSPPLLEIGFYKPPDPLFVGQPGSLPIQVLNLDRKAVVLSRVRVESAGAEMSSDELPIGYLDTGLDFTIDALAVPLQSGPLEVLVSVDYIDDFNAPQTIQQPLAVEVFEFEAGPESSPEGGFPVESETPQPESFWDRVLRFLRGLLGLDSAPPQTAPLEEVPSEGPIEIVPGAPGTKG